MDPLDYFEDTLNIDLSLQAVEIEAKFVASKDKGWVSTWSARVFQDDAHKSFNPNSSLDRLNDVIEVYLEDLSGTFMLKSPKKVVLNFERAHPQQDVWRCEYDIEREEGIFAAFWRWIKELCF